MTFKSIVMALAMTGAATLANAEMAITSSAFNEGDTLPTQYSCNGKDISPPLSFDNVPEGTKSFVLIMDDPDAPSGTWIHWVLYNLPADTQGLPENAPSEAVWSDGTMQGRNSWGDTKWGGACPPDGEHRYFFKLYALDTVLDLKKKSSLRKVKKAMKGHILAEAKLMAKYG